LALSTLHGRGAPAPVSLRSSTIAFWLVRCTSPRLSGDHARRVAGPSERRRLVLQR
jgi:hypothetical protein